MILDLVEIVEEPGQRWEVPIDFPPAATPDLDFAGPASGRTVVYNTGSELIFTGTVRATLQAACVRCLEPSDLALSGEIEATVELGTIASLLTGKPVELEPHLAAVFSPQGADLAELIRQTLVLAVPLQTLCSPDCEGLCPRCGQNLNVGSCECPDEQADPRLQALAAWHPQTAESPAGARVPDDESGGNE